MNTEAIKQELETLTMEQLIAVKNIFEFNLRGLMIGDREDTQRKLILVQEELVFRSVEN